jgi:hypothetical protein
MWVTCAMMTPTMRPLRFFRLAVDVVTATRFDTITSCHNSSRDGVRGRRDVTPHVKVRFHPANTAKTSRFRLIQNHIDLNEYAHPGCCWARGPCPAPWAGAAVGTSAAAVESHCHSCVATLPLLLELGAEDWGESRPAGCDEGPTSGLKSHKGRMKISFTA